MIMFICATLMLFITVICIFIANAKTSQAPDSTLRCLLLRRKAWRRRKSGVNDEEEQTDWLRTDLLTDLLIPAVLKYSTQGKLYSLTPPLCTHTHIHRVWTDPRTKAATRRAELLKPSNHKPRLWLQTPPPHLLHPTSSRLSVIRAVSFCPITAWLCWSSINSGESIWFVLTYT